MAKYLNIFRGAKVEPKDVSSGDIVILVIGPTGVGKSTFINKATNGNNVEVGHGLGSCTGAVQGFKCPYRDDETRTVVFVDTPAFNHDTRSASDIEKAIAKWLKQTADRNVKVAGILYLHKINEKRITESPIIHLRPFEKLCGKDFPKKVVLVTTFWKFVSLETGNQREKELRDKYWSTMTAGGSSGIHRFESTAESASDSAWGAVDLLLQ